MAGVYPSKKHPVQDFRPKMGMGICPRVGLYPELYTTGNTGIEAFQESPQSVTEREHAVSEWHDLRGNQDALSPRSRAYFCLLLAVLEPLSLIDVLSEESMCKYVHLPVLY